MASRHAAAVLHALGDRVRTLPAPRMAEAMIQAAVVKHLQARAAPGVFWFHCPNGGTRHRIEAARMVGQGVVAGVPDLVILARGRVFGLELKAEKGRVSPMQVEVHRKWTTAGGEIAVAFGLDDALAVLERWEIIRPTARAA